MIQIECLIKKKKHHKIPIAHIMECTFNNLTIHILIQSLIKYIIFLFLKTRPFVLKSINTIQFPQYGTKLFVIVKPIPIRSESKKYTNVLI